MNALWISRIADYIHTKEVLYTAKKIISIKTKAQNTLLKRSKLHTRENTIAIYRTKNIQELLLEEARHAKYFWVNYKKLLPQWTGFTHRTQHGEDVVNKLLDIGYHHITNVIKNICKEKDISTAVGFLHVAHKSTSEPLVYDLVELFRSDIVDREVLTFVRAKKKEINTLESKHIAHFVFKIKRRLQKKVYLKECKQCETYLYYMDLQITHLIKAVNHGEIFEPFVLPERHENRCGAKSVDIV